MKNLLRLGIFTLTILLAAFGIFLVITPGVSSTEEIQRKVAVTVDLNEDGTVSRGEYDFEYSSNTPLRDISPNLINAVVASEDRRFYSRNVLYLPARFLQATVVCVYYKVIKQGQHQCAGNSTVTQQLAKMLWLREQRTPYRKITELVWAIKLELFLSKDEIMEMYLNRIFFGAGAYGADMGQELYLVVPQNSFLLLKPRWSQYRSRNPLRTYWSIVNNLSNAQIFCLN